MMGCSGQWSGLGFIDARESAHNSLFIANELEQNLWLPIRCFESRLCKMPVATVRTPDGLRATETCAGSNKGRGYSATPESTPLKDRHYDEKKHYDALHHTADWEKANGPGAAEWVARDQLEANCMTASCATHRVDLKGVS